MALWLSITSWWRWWSLWSSPVNTPPSRLKSLISSVEMHSKQTIWTDTKRLFSSQAHLSPPRAELCKATFTKTLESALIVTKSRNHRTWLMTRSVKSSKKKFTSCVRASSCQNTRRSRGMKFSKLLQFTKTKNTRSKSRFSTPHRRSAFPNKLSSRCLCWRRCRLMIASIMSTVTLMRM